MPSMPQLASFGGRSNWTANRRSFLFPRFAGGLRLERRPRAAFRPPGGIVTSSAAVVDGHVYFGGGSVPLSIALQRTMGT